jgi:hypothetical protein
MVNIYLFSYLHWKQKFLMYTLSNELLSYLATHTLLSQYGAHKV